MKCRNCGCDLPEMATFCSICGTPVGEGNSYCSSCGAVTAPDAVICSGCGALLNQNAQTQAQPSSAEQPAYQQPQYNQYQQPQGGAYQQVPPQGAGAYQAPPQGYQAPPQGAYQQPMYQQQPPYQQPNGYNPYQPPKSKTTAGLLGIFLGQLGIHNFYLGYTQKAVIQLLVTLLLCWTFVAPIGMWVWAIVESVQIFQGQVCDANGRPLAD